MDQDLEKAALWLVGSKVTDLSEVFDKLIIKAINDRGEEIEVTLTDHAMGGIYCKSLSVNNKQLI